MTIGRDPAVEITINDTSISRRHATIKKIPSASGVEVMITDLGSANGTLVNDQKLAPNSSRALHKEDMIKLGNTIVKFLPAGELEILFYGNLGSAAHTDPLTKAYNKGYLMEALEAEFKRAKALHTDFSVIFLDLDHFKKINDQHGHDAGDFVLRECTQLLRTSNLRPKDVFARYGGEEFVVLLSGLSVEAAMEMAEKMRRAIESHAFIYDNVRLPVTASIGVAELNSTVSSAQTLLKNADQALYQAKNSGRNRVMSHA
jgi:diguanylate cyclase (GGDEF)-like protein